MNALTMPSPIEMTPGTRMPIRRILGAYLTEVKYESLRMLRSPGFSIPFLVLPVPVYLFFGVMLAAPAVAKNPGVANYLFSGFSVFAVMGPALFGVGCVLAIEREAGFLKLKRALPAPGGAHLLAKATMAMVFAAAAVLTLLVAGSAVGKISLSASQLVVMTVVMTAGALPFAAIGLFIGAHVSANVAPAISNLVFLPMLWLSGLFIPLPKFLERWAVIWPAFHLNQAALGWAGVSEFSFLAPSISAAVLVGITVIFGGLAIRRLARQG
jgi:ABC-2 type transport system permease protein